MLYRYPTAKYMKRRWQYGYVSVIYSIDPHIVYCKSSCHMLCIISKEFYVKNVLLYALDVILGTCAEEMRFLDKVLGEYWVATSLGE